jgi:hypothetical protein
VSGWSPNIIGYSCISTFPKLTQGQLLPELFIFETDLCDGDVLCMDTMFCRACSLTQNDPPPRSYIYSIVDELSTVDCEVSLSGDSSGTSSARGEIETALVMFKNSSCASVLFDCVLRLVLEVKMASVLVVCRKPLIERNRSREIRKIG